MPERNAWLLYLSGVAAECIADRVEGQRIARLRKVDPCAQCTRGFKSHALANGRCDPLWLQRVPDESTTDA